MNKLTLKKIAAGVMTVMVLSVFALPMVVSAQTNTNGLDLGLNDAAGIGLGDKDLKTGINDLIKFALSFLGILAVIIILWGGFIWMTAAGDETKVKKAQNLIVAGIIGIVIILSAYMIASFVITQIASTVTQP